MKIRRATNGDIPRLNHLLYQVAQIHHNGRPDIFKPATKKYTDLQLAEIISNPETPIFVWVDENDITQGYAFCIHKITKSSHLLCDRRELYIDDLCVDSDRRGKGIGRELYNYCVSYGKENKFDTVTLNVWCLNDSAMAFYKKLGMTPLKVVMEEQL